MTRRCKVLILLALSFAMAAVFAKGQAKGRPSPSSETPARLIFSDTAGHRILSDGRMSYEIALAGGHPMSELGTVWIDFGAPLHGSGAGEQSAPCGTDPFALDFLPIETALVSSVLTITASGKLDALAEGLFGMGERDTTRASLKLTWWAKDGNPIPLGDRFDSRRGVPRYWNEQWSLQWDGAQNSSLATVTRLTSEQCEEAGSGAPCWLYEVAPGARLICVPSGKGGLDHRNAVRHSLYSVPTGFHIDVP